MPIRMCDQKNSDGSPCREPAVHSYRWDWGETGACCAAHAPLMQQIAVNLSSREVVRTVNLAPLENAAEAPLERSERTALIAGRLAAEAETAELKNRGAQLYRQNVDLTAQVQRLTLRHSEADAQLTDARAKVEALQDKLDERETDLGRVTDELQRMQTLAAFAPETGKKAGKAPEPKAPEPKG